MSHEREIETILQATVKVHATKIQVKDMFTPYLHAAVILRRDGTYYDVCEPINGKNNDGRRRKNA